MAKNGQTALAIVQKPMQEIGMVDVRAWVAGVEALEADAGKLAKRADKLPEKATKKSAEKALVIVQEARLAKRLIPERWDLLRKLQGLAKAMIGKRKLAEAHFERAITAGTDHHNAWVSAEQRRIAEEERAAREAAEQRADAPLEVQTTPTRMREAPKPTGRLLKSAIVTDSAALIAAVIEGKHGIPKDVLMPDPVRLNEYAKQIGEIIDGWPGVRYEERRSR